MRGEQENADTAPRRAAGHPDGITAEIAERLADMALMSEKHHDLSFALGEVQQMLAAVVQRHPEFQGASAELQGKLEQLEQLQKAMGSAVMKYSHDWEDTAVGIASAPT